jgi:hypothetical protein
MDHLRQLLIRVVDDMAFSQTATPPGDDFSQTMASMNRAVQDVRDTMIAAIERAER